MTHYLPYQKRHSLIDMDFDEVSLVPIGDNPYALVAFSKNAPTDGREPFSFSIAKGSELPSLERAPGDNDNWVEANGGLPAYIDNIARSLHYKQGMPIGRAISVAIGSVEHWATGGDDVEETTRTKAVKAWAEFEALQTRAEAKRIAKSVETGEESPAIPRSNADLRPILTVEPTRGVCMSDVAKSAEDEQIVTDADASAEVTDEEVAKAAEFAQTLDEDTASEADEVAKAADADESEDDSDSEYIRVLKEANEALEEANEALTDRLNALESGDTDADDTQADQAPTDAVEKAADEATEDEADAPAEETVEKSGDEQPADEAVSLEELAKSNPVIAELVAKAAAADEATARAAQAEEIAKAAAERETVASYLSKAAPLAGMGAEVEAVAKALRDVAEHCSADTGNTLNTMLSTAFAQVEKSGLFREVGTGPEGEVSVSKSVEAGIALIQKNNDGISRAKAELLFFEKNPHLYNAADGEE